MRSHVAVLLAALALAASAHAATPPAHDIAVRIDPETRVLEGSDTITFASRESAVLLLSSRFRLHSVSADGRRIIPEVSANSGLRRIRLPAARQVSLHWSGTLERLDGSRNHRDTLTDNTPATGADGTYLPAASGWYPGVSGQLESYRLSLDLPAGQRGLVPGRLIEESEQGGRYRARFDFPQPAEGIALMAGPYRIEERQVSTAAGTQVRLRTYFHAAISQLSAGYLDSLLGYLDLYERRIGPYPFSEFSVVSSPTPTGFGMPTLTYLGVEVLRLPFIRSTSLGHEVLHNWWGNGVYPDYSQGNWSEGLTTFMADYAYKEQQGAAAALATRLGWLRDYASIPPGSDQALTSFTSRTHGSSQIIGYHKAAMLFLMLRDAIDEEAFNEGLRGFWRSQRFRIAGWKEMREAFEASSGRRLEEFFGQWLARAGAPDLRLVDAQAEPAGTRWRVSVTLAQSGPAYRVSVPLQLRTGSGETLHRVDFVSARETFVLESSEQPLQIELDAQFRVFRRLGSGEAPPILRSVMLAPEVAMPDIAIDATLRNAARALAAQMLEQPPQALKAIEAHDKPALLVIGLHREVDQWLARESLPPRPVEVAANRGSAQVWMLHADPARTIAVISAADAAALSALLRPLPHYGQQSFLVFDGSRVIAQGTWPGRPQSRDLLIPAKVSQPAG